jgi:hypothetical protein
MTYKLRGPSLREVFEARAIARPEPKPVEPPVLSRERSKIRGFQSRVDRISGRFRLSETCSKTAQKGNWCLGCLGFGIRFGRRVAKRTIFHKSCADPTYAHQALPRSRLFCGCVKQGPRFQLCRAFRPTLCSSAQALGATAGVVRRANRPQAIQIQRRLRSP